MRYRNTVNAISRLNNDINNFDFVNGKTYQLQEMECDREYLIEKLKNTSLFKWVLIELIYYPKYIYYTIADKIADIKNKTNNDEGDYPF